MALQRLRAGASTRPTFPNVHRLEFYARHFATVESNNAFYRLPEGERFAAWARATPDDFVMAVKMSRYLTHIKRLRDPEEPVARFLDRVQHLGDKLGPVLLQLPPTLRADLELLDATLSRFPAHVTWPSSFVTTRGGLKRLVHCSNSTAVLCV